MGFSDHLVVRAAFARQGVRRSRRDDARRVRGVIERSLEAYNRRDLDALRGVCSYPFVKLDWLAWSEATDPASLTVNFDSSWEHSNVRYLDVLTPQADDKVVVALTVARFAPNGDELPPEESVYLVTRQHHTWGVQASSTRYGRGGLL
jgi:hypothetical protein